MYLFECSLSSHLCHHLLLSLECYILTGVKCCLIAVLISVFLMVNDFEHFFILFGHLYFENCFLMHFAHFLIRLVFVVVVVIPLVAVYFRF